MGFNSGFKGLIPSKVWDVVKQCEFSFLYSFGRTSFSLQQIFYTLYTSHSERCAQILNVQLIKKNPTRCNTVSKFYYSIFTWSSTCFGRHAAHHQEPKTALAASGFSYVEGCGTCSWWTLSGTVCLTAFTNYTSNNLRLMKNQGLPVQF